MKSTDWFYKTKAWKDCRKAYAKSVGGLCEHCLKRGVISAGEIVHHKQHLNAGNINDPSITLSFDNLELLCRDCHGKEHSTSQKRFKVDALGRVAPYDD